MFIVWSKETQRSHYLAKALGAEFKQVYYKKIGPYNLPTFLRYILQATETLLMLFYERPRTVIVQNPPVFAPLVALIYSKLTGAKLVIDSHTAAFLDKKWIKFYGLFKFAAKRAVFNSCHNYKNLEILKSWGIEPAMAMHAFNPIYDLAELDAPLSDKKIEDVITKSGLSVMMVNRFADDDDWETVIKTARLMPKADFFITGDPKEAGKEIKNLPANVFLTGYLAHQEFLKLMRRVKVVLTFSLRPDTLLWSIREAMALNKPFITTDSEVLRHYFGSVALFVKSDAGQIKEKIGEALEKEMAIKNEIKLFLEKDKIRWERELLEYKSIIINL